MNTKIIKFSLLVASLVMFGCSRFEAKRVDSKESDEKAMKITDQWVQGDTERAIADVWKQIQEHKGFKRYMGGHQDGVPKLFVGEVQNTTSEPYFPIGDLNDELLQKLSESGDFVLVDASAREHILKEITYQNDGMVDPATAKNIGRQTGADLMIFGNIYMKPESRDGQTIKEYTVNLRLTDIEKGVEVVRTRAKLYKYSDQAASGW